MNLTGLSAEAIMTAVAKTRRPRVGRWCGVRGGPVGKLVVCYVCDDIIDTYCGRFAMPKHVDDAVHAHFAYHAGVSA